MNDRLKVAMDDYEKQRLENWKRGSLSVDEVKQELKFSEDLLEGLTRRLERLQPQFAQDYVVGFDEWDAARIKALQEEIPFWVERVAFEEGLLNQPR